MAEYIERKKLINELEHLHEDNELSYLGVYDCVKTIPTADVVEVVRCKDCEYCKQNSYTKDYVCTKMPNANVVKLEHYCSYGERKCNDD